MSDFVLEVTPPAEFVIEIVRPIGLEVALGGGQGPTGLTGSIGSVQPFEDLNGTLDGANRNFSTTRIPDGRLLIVVKNGIVQRAGSTNDFTIASSIITFNTLAIPAPGDVLQAAYTF
jgi:hypothetical protein